MTINCPAGPHTHSLAETCALLGCDSESWLIKRVRNGTFPGHKIVRDIRFSDQDIEQILDLCAVSAQRPLQLVEFTR